MKDLIDDIAKRYLVKGKRLEVIRRYIRMKYRINIDSSALLNRVKSFNLELRDTQLI